MFFLICSTYFLKRINLAEVYKDIEELNMMLSNQSQKTNLDNSKKYMEIYKDIQKYVREHLEKNISKFLQYTLEEIINIITNIIFVFTITNEIISNEPKEMKIKEDFKTTPQKIKKINNNLLNFLEILKIQNKLEFNLQDIIKSLKNILLNSIEKSNNPNHDDIYITKNLFQLCHIEKKLPYLKFKFSNKQFKNVPMLKLLENIKNKKFYNSQEIEYVKKYVSINYDINIGIHLFSNNNREIQRKIQKSEEISFNKIIIITSIVLISVLTPTFLLIYKKLK